MLSKHIRERGFCRTSLLAAFCLLAGGASAAEQSSTGKHFLWRVTNAPAPFYLLGSCHFLRGSDYPLGRVIDDRIKQSRQFIFEWDNELDERLVDKKMNDAARYPRGTTLKQKVRPETYAYTQKIARTRASSYNDVKPWAIAMFMFGHPSFHDVRAYLGVERYVRIRAPGGSKFGGLETLDEHIQVLSTMSDIEAEAFLLQTYVYAESSKKQFSDGVAAWKNGDVQRLLQVYSPQEREAPYLTARFIDRRNVKWIPKIEAAIKSGRPTMVVAGARHFCGPYSVVTLLEKRGCTLEQL